MSETDVSAIITAHKEGLLAGPAARSLQSAVALAESEGLRCEAIVVLDRADALTAHVVREALGNTATYVETDTGDPGQARNAGIAAARGAHACFLDGDDLWSENWIVAAHKAARKRPDAVHHSACNMVFGNKQLVFWHIDSESAAYDQEFMSYTNFWDALCLARTELFRENPFFANDLSIGFGHEDWHWNSVTIAKGIPHKPVPGTIHFKRARHGSQMSKVDSLGGVRWAIPDDSLRNEVAAINNG